MAKPNSAPKRPPPNPAAQRKRRLQELRTQLEAERAAWARWLTRLKRAVHQFLKLQRRIARLEREVAKLGSG